ncbi:MAG: hypothetical protein EXS16_00305 [Gemmataceae bacterium]|nr:hypothetical protein [Gemmataceae bacterium]
MPSNLATIRDDLPNELESVELRGHGSATFLYLTHHGREMEISECDEGIWLEFWDNSDDEDAGPVKDMTVLLCEDAIREARRWLR